MSSKTMSRERTRCAPGLLVWVVALCAQGWLVGAQGGSPGSLTTADLERLYASGVTYERFAGGVERRAELWKHNDAEAKVDPELLARARALKGTWRLLAVTTDSCSDSASTIPFIARLVEEVDTLHMRIVAPTAGRAVMEAHRTPDGRPATPTLVLLDEHGKEAGCWIERPASLQSWILGEGARLPPSESQSRKMEWYEKDKGAETLRDIVTMLEAAAAGRVACPATR